MAGVGGEFHHHRPRRAVAQGVKGAAHHVAHLRWVVDRLDALGDAAIVGRHREVRTHVDFAAHHPAGQHEDGHIVRKRLRQAAHRVLRARLALHCHHPETLPVARAAEAVGGHHRAALMAEHHWPDAGLGGALDERIGGEARHCLDAFALEYFGDVVDAVHAGFKAPAGLAKFAATYHTACPGMDTASAAGCARLVDGAALRAVWLLGHPTFSLAASCFTKCRCAGEFVPAASVARAVANSPRHNAKVSSHKPGNTSLRTSPAASFGKGR